MRQSPRVCSHLVLVVAVVLGMLAQTARAQGNAPSADSEQPGAPTVTVIVAEPATEASDAPEPEAPEAQPGDPAGAPPVASPPPTVVVVRGSTSLPAAPVVVPAGYGVPQGAAPTYGAAPIPQRRPRLRRRRWIEGETLNPGEHLVVRRRMGLLVGGAVGLGVGLVLSALQGAGADYGLGALPFAGPAFYQAEHGTPEDLPMTFMLTGAQVVGVALFIAGLLPKEYVEYYAGMTPGGMQGLQVSL